MLQASTPSTADQNGISSEPEVLIELPKEFHGRWRYSISKCDSEGFPEDGMLISYLMTSRRGGVGGRPTSQFTEIRVNSDGTVYAYSNSWGELLFSAKNESEIVIEDISTGRKFDLILCSKIEDVSR